MKIADKRHYLLENGKIEVQSFQHRLVRTGGDAYVDGFKVLAISKSLKKLYMLKSEFEEKGIIKK